MGSWVLCSLVYELTLSLCSSCSSFVHWELLQLALVLFIYVPFTHTICCHRCCSFFEHFLTFESHRILQTLIFSLPQLQNQPAFQESQSLLLDNGVQKSNTGGSYAHYYCFQSFQGLEVGNICMYTNLFTYTHLYLSILTTTNP